MPALFESIAGMPVDYETLYVGRWTQRLMVADRYRRGRVLLAGDAAHLVIPTGGLGMNTGAGDATDLAWKLAGTLHGWGGPGCWTPTSPSAGRSGCATSPPRDGRRPGAAAWRAAWRPEIADDGPRGRGRPRRARRGGRPRAALEQRPARDRARLPLPGLAADRRRRGGRARPGRLRLRPDHVPRRPAAAPLARRRQRAARPSRPRLHAARASPGRRRRGARPRVRRARRAVRRRSRRARRPRTRCSRATPRCSSAPTCTSCGAVTGRAPSRSAWRRVATGHADGRDARGSAAATMEVAR